MLQLGPGLGLPAAPPGLPGRAVWAGQGEVPQPAPAPPGLGVEVVVQPAQGGVTVTVLHWLSVPCLFLAMSRLSFILCCSLPAASHSLLTLAPAPVLANSRLMPRSSSAMPAHNSSVD